jgi:hypothetical protein
MLLGALERFGTLSTGRHPHKNNFPSMPDIFKNITVTAVIAAMSLVLVFAVARSDKLKVWRAAAHRPRTKKACATSLTLRISNIPRNITEGELQHMVDLAGEVNASPGTADRPELLAWSLARSGHSERSFVATATVREPPAPSQLESAIKRTIGVGSGQLRVDLDFFGLTPLADPQDPAVE